MGGVILLRPRLRQGGAQPEASQAATPPKRCTPLGAGRKGALNPSNRWQRLFVSSTTFPGVPRPHRCRIKDMHHSQDRRERGRSPGERRLQGARIALPPPEQIPPSRQPNCCELQVASGNRSSRGGVSRPKELVFISVIHNGLLRSNLHIQVAQSPFFPGRPR